MVLYVQWCWFVIHVAIDQGPGNPLGICGGDGLLMHLGCARSGAEQVGISEVVSCPLCWICGSELVPGRFFFAEQPDSGWADGCVREFPYGIDVWTSPWIFLHGGWLAREPR
jgi:hypothetical protein